MLENENKYVLRYLLKVDVDVRECKYVYHEVLKMDVQVRECTKMGIEYEYDNIVCITFLIKYTIVFNKDIIVYYYYTFIDGIEFI